MDTMECSTALKGGIYKNYEATQGILKGNRAPGGPWNQVKSTLLQQCDLAEGG